jgi:N-acetylglucosamine kinase-like BadF-type ATPase
MLLVADGGSSKTDWVLQKTDKSTQKITSGGFNPIFNSEKDIARFLNQIKDFDEIESKITEIYFFGAGCTTPDKREIVSNALSQKFVNAFISVDSDSLGSAIATCKDKPGISCILGTESNVSFYDGNQNFPSKLGLGYILGEEGSGTYFGKILITDFLYQKMPNEIADSFYDAFKINKEVVIKNLYQKSYPNYYLASFAPFMSTHASHPYVKDLVFKGLQAFINTHVLIYPDFRSYYCHFVGSIAYHFKDTLKEICTQNEVNCGLILEKHIDELFDWIKKREGF